MAELARIAGQYAIVEISVFGSSIRADLGPEGDVDLLVAFDRNADASLFDLIAIATELDESSARTTGYPQDESAPLCRLMHEILHTSST